MPPILPLRRMQHSKKNLPPASPSNKAGIDWPIWALIAFVAALYANTLSNGFVLDDSMIITKNAYTAKGVAGWAEIFANDSFKGYYTTSNTADFVEGGRFRPLSIAVFAVFFQLFGANPMPFHFFNLLLMAGIAWMLYRLLQLLLPTPDNEPSPWISLPFLATALFVAHPVHTEVVANIKCADELWALLLSLATLRSMVLFVDGRGQKHFWLGTVAFVLACFAKENAVTFLAVVPLALYLFRPEGFKAQGLRIFGALLAAFLFFFIWRGIALNWNFGQESSRVLINNPFIEWNGAQWQPMSLAKRTAMIAHSLGKYLQLLVFPHPLTHDYYPRQIPVTGWSDWKAIASALVYIGIGLVGLRTLKTNKTVAFGILFFLLTLSIVSNILVSIGTNLSERFIFMPSLGFVLVFAYLLKKAISNNTVLFSVVALLLILFSIKTITRNNDWKDNITLAQKDIVVSGNSAKLNNSLGAQLTEAALKSKNPTERSQQLEQALACFQKALTHNPTYIEAVFGRGSVYFMQQNLKLAINDYLIAEKIDPNYPNLRTNLSLALREYGKAALQSGDKATALKLFQEAKQRFSTDPETNQLLQQASQ